MDQQIQTAPTPLILLQFLRWTADRPRSYGEAMDAWRTSCPRLSAWEDAIDQGLVEVDSEGAATHAAARVRVTARGLALLG
eukprot:gene43814-biopygen29968